jgi:hypothetical protein
VNESLAHSQTTLLRAEATRARAEVSDLILVNRAEIAKHNAEHRYDSGRSQRERAILAAERRAIDLEQLATNAEDALRRMVERQQSRSRRKKSAPAAGVHPL